MAQTIEQTGDKLGLVDYGSSDDEGGSPLPGGTARNALKVVVDCRPKDPSQLVTKEKLTAFFTPRAALKATPADSPAGVETPLEVVTPPNPPAPPTPVMESMSVNWKGRSLVFECVAGADEQAQENALCAHLEKSDGHVVMEACKASLNLEYTDPGGAVLTINQNFLGFAAGVSQSAVCKHHCIVLEKARPCG